MSQQPSMMTCPDCGKEISPRAKACPNCGCADLSPAKLQHSFDNNPISSTIGLIMAIGLIIFACVLCNKCDNSWRESIKKNVESGTSQPRVLTETNQAQVLAGRNIILKHYATLPAA